MTDLKRIIDLYKEEEAVSTNKDVGYKILINGKDDELNQIGQ